MTARERPTTDSVLAFSLVTTLVAATLILWISAYWPVALFEISAFLMAAFALVTGRRPDAHTRLPMYVLAGIVLWGCLQLLPGWSVNRFATERATLQWMSLLAFYYVGACVFKEVSLAKAVRRTVVWFAFALAVEGIVQAWLAPGSAYGLFPTGYRDFVMGPIVYHTHFAAFVETVLPIALYFSLREPGRAYLFLGIAAVLLTAVVVSASRGGFIIACGEVIAVLVMGRLGRVKTQQGMGKLIAAFAGITALLTVIAGYETTTARFAAGDLAAGRVQFAISTLHMIAARPFTGWGLGCWPAVYPAFATFDPGAVVNQAHTDWLQWTAEGGLPVGLAMLTLAAWAVKPALRSIWGIGVLAVLIHAMFDYPFSRPAVAAWPILMLSMAAAVPTGRKKQGLGDEPIPD